MILVIDLRFRGYGRFPPLAKWAGLPFRAHNAGADLMPVGFSRAASKQIVVKQHGGTIDVATEPGSFIEFIVNRYIAA